MKVEQEFADLVDAVSDNDFHVLYDLSKRVRHIFVLDYDGLITIDRLSDVPTSVCTKLKNAGIKVFEVSLRARGQIEEVNAALYGEVVFTFPIDGMDDQEMCEVYDPNCDMLVFGFVDKGYIFTGNTIGQMVEVMDIHIILRAMELMLAVRTHKSEGDVVTYHKRPRLASIFEIFEA